MSDTPVPAAPAAIVTDSLGFRLEISVVVRPMAAEIRGEHKTYERDGKVRDDMVHKITIIPDLSDDELIEVVAHEAYHVFYSVRHLIAVDEETEASVFGQLVEWIYATVKRAANE